MLIVSVVPLLGMAYMAFTDWHLTQIGPIEFPFFGNFARLRRDPRFIASMRVQAVLSIATIAVQIPLGTAAALAVEQLGPRLQRFRGLLMAPFVVPYLVVALIWLTLFTPTLSPLNALLNELGVRGPEWFSSGSTALAAIVIADAWASFPLIFIVILAGLNGIPPQLYEAAATDGASQWQRIGWITLPMLRPALLLALLLRLIESFKHFPLIFVMTAGGPGRATEVPNYYAYLQGLLFGDIGYASAMALGLFGFTVILSYAVARLGRNTSNVAG